MTTATINFDQPTLFKEGGFARETPSAPAPDRAVTPSRPEPTTAPSAERIVRGGETLDDLVSAAWNGLAAHTSVACPVCEGSMAPRYGSGPQPVGGRCKRCGSTLG